MSRKYTQRTKEQDDAEGVDIFGAPLAAARQDIPDVRGSGVLLSLAKQGTTAHRGTSRAAASGEQLQLAESFTESIKGVNAIMARNFNAGQRKT